MQDLEGVLRDLFHSNYLSGKETNSLGVCGLFPNHTFQVQAETQVSRFSVRPLSAPSQCQCLSFPGALRLTVDREAEGVCGTPGVISQHRRSRGGDGHPPSTLTPFPFLAIADRSSHSIPGMALPRRSPAFSLPQQPRWDTHGLQFNQTI